MSNMLPYYFGLIRVMRGGWKQQFQQCRDTTSGEEWALARWAIKLSCTQSKDLCIWQLSGQPLLNRWFVKSRPLRSLSTLGSIRNWPTFQRTWWQNHHCGKVLCHGFSSLGTSGSERELILHLVLDLVSYGHDAYLNPAEETQSTLRCHPLSLQLRITWHWVLLPLLPGNRQNAWGKMFKQLLKSHQYQSCKLLH